jgi:hypothetical protein
MAKGFTVKARALAKQRAAEQEWDYDKPERDDKEKHSFPLSWGGGEYHFRILKTLYNFVLI